MAKRWIVERNDNEGQADSVRRVGAPCKTGDKAQALRQRMRAQQPRGSSVHFTVRQVRV